MGRKRVSADTLSAILPLAAEGWRLFPLGTRAKTPAVGDWPTVATTDETRLKEWERDFPSCNWGMATGAGSSVFVVDIDGERGSAWLAEQLRVRGDAWAQTRRAKTARGLHLFFAWPGDGIYLRNSAGKIASGVDVRGAGGFVVIPPSVHPEGSSYEWLTPPDHALLPAPAWLLTLASKPETVSPALGDGVGIIPEGERNSADFDCRRSAATWYFARSHSSRAIGRKSALQTAIARRRS
jgi:hypothetical protein